MLREQAHRIWCRFPFWGAILIGCILLVPGLVEYNEGPKGPGINPNLYNVYEAFMWAEKTWFILFVPLLAVLPFADSYSLERASGYIRSILIRCTYRRYLLSKLTVNSIAGGLAVALPLGIIFAASHLFFTTGLAPFYESRLRPVGPASSIYWEYPALFILFLIGVGFVFGAVYATLGLSISFWTTNRYIVLATPFTLYHVANFILGVPGLEKWTPPMTFFPEGVNNSTWLTIFGELGFIFVVSLIGIALKANKELATLDKESE
ncbi:MAG: hypothetical protein LC121_08295 [Anaerolineae bacterium]|jgi:hypothetical protein|nr:hypothetical protein [Anaerolineae bacterium]